MRRCAALLLMLAACGNRPVATGHAEGTLPGGAYLRVTRFATSAAYFRTFGGSSNLSEGRRYYTESRSRVYSGYEVRTRILGGGQFMVYFLMPGAPPEGDYRLAPSAPLPAPTMVREGQPFEIELYRGASGARLYDELRLFHRRP